MTAEEEDTSWNASINSSRIREEMLFLPPRIFNAGKKFLPNSCPKNLSLPKTPNWKSVEYWSRVEANFETNIVGRTFFTFFFPCKILQGKWPTSPRANLVSFFRIASPISDTQRRGSARKPLCRQVIGPILGTTVKPNSLAHAQNYQETWKQFASLFPSFFPCALFCAPQIRKSQVIYIYLFATFCGRNGTTEEKRDKSAW